MAVVPPPIPTFAEDTNQLSQEYGSFLHRVTVDDSDANRLYIETKENVTLTVEFSSKGWKVCKVQPDDAPLQVKALENEIYEMPEGFLMAASDEFKRLWHESLVMKLSNLTRFGSDDGEEEENKA
ncbi:hypothetical protein TWF106_008678 [Orbilia oligospora]|uniref:GSKIP domain-containing protein n=1 Tax=Orbilia oligospora TaxID=2813651 RepID=A0A6G1M690_ORBOL|nr:hypothetical protein TWF788_006785 [Orbilia oligospora]KAF3203059.1 hypothetical protein TWF679_010525 [Orbilia oligospora]KAF3215671.1 hypothetical protein TWF106_008678 [Orbilia oligospora]KAF3227221.1 hypothetical protein TWF191_004088 [Orbilia oligospora]KAF3246869.1 hypothetical protein TWF192_006684 [Orbilia oligospora]